MKPKLKYKTILGIRIINGKSESNQFSKLKTFENWLGNNDGRCSCYASRIIKNTNNDNIKINEITYRYLYKQGKRKSMKHPFNEYDYNVWNGGCG